MYYQILRCSSRGGDNACIAGSARKLPLWQGSSTTCSRCHARLIMAIDTTLFMIRRKVFRLKVASVAMVCSLTRPMRCPAFHRPKAMLASRCAWGFSCDLIFTPQFFGLPDTPFAHSFRIADVSPNNRHL